LEFGVIKVLIIQMESKYKRGGRLLINCLLISTLLVLTLAVNAQADKKQIREGNREYKKERYPESEILYRKAAGTSNHSPDAVFNTGDALYKQKKYEEAAKQFTESTNLNEVPAKKSDGFYNLGNSLLMAKKFEESIDAYKKALKLKPDNPEAKYNLAYAQDLLKKQQEQQKQQQQQDQKNKDDQKDKDKNDKNDKNQDQKDKEKDKDKQNDQDNKQDDKQQEQKQQEGMSKEDAQRILNAMANDEKNVQEKVKLAKAAKEKVKTVKNW
jgi:Ca-activated chloride channel homolog